MYTSHVFIANSSKWGPGSVGGCGHRSHHGSLGQERETWWGGCDQASGRQAFLLPEELTPQQLQWGSWGHDKPPQGAWDPRSDTPANPSAKPGWMCDATRKGDFLEPGGFSHPRTSRQCSPNLSASRGSLRGRGGPGLGVCHLPSGWGEPSCLSVEGVLARQAL